jgi:type II secretory ATPase GspE/PulE/Tfp pilus assembly ATPase PilB-like protein
MYDSGIDFHSAGAPASLAPVPALPERRVAPAANDGGSWPFPLQCVPGDGAERIVAEFCEMDLRDERKIAGTLVSFSPSERKLTLLAAHSVSLETVGFDDILSLRLTRPVAIQRPQKRLNGDVEKLLTQSYRVTLIDGVSVSGETMGSVEDEAGLYLFLPREADTVERRFCPHGAMRSHQVGGLLGEILLETQAVSRVDIESALREQHASRGQKLGELLEKTKAISREDLTAALKRQENMPVMRLGEALLQMNYITQEQLDAALRQQKSDRKTPLGQILVNSGVIDEHRLKQALAEKLGIPFVDLSVFVPELSATSRISEDVARKCDAVPLYVENSVMVVAMNDPLNTAHIESLRFHAQMRVAPVMAARDAVAKAIQNSYGASISISAWDAPAEKENPAQAINFSSNADEKSKTEELLTQLNLSSAESNEADEPQVAESDNSLVKLVNKVLIDAYLQKATDIHIENYPGKQDSCVRFRRDGALYDYLTIPYRFRNAIISRLKIMSSLDISEKRRPQDGKLEFALPGAPKLEFRIATIPTANGLEDIVMRLLAGATLRSLAHIGMDERLTNELTRMVGKPYGMILVCGPTGSGKTTTLHSLLGQINTRERKIWTAEDPVEITHPGLRQVQVNTKIGWTFAATLRAFLRGDPDVIMVGEMRDLETARIAMEASLTGHLVLSTLHTNSAVDSIVRLLDMGLDPFNFADALLGVISQRLARRVCESCGRMEAAGGDELEALAAEYCAETDTSPHAVLAEWRQQYAKDGEILLRRPAGCAECGQTGYRGRVGLYELYALDRKARALIQQRASMEELLQTARSNGMTTLKQNGIERIVEGLTDLKQVRAVCG